MYKIYREFKGQIEFLKHVSSTDDKTFESKKEALDVVNILNGYRLNNVNPWYIKAVNEESKRPSEVNKD